MGTDGGRPVGAVLIGILTVGTFLLVGLTGGATSAAGPKLQPSATDAAGAVDVSDCRTIDRPGRYVLTEDIRNSSAEECITIVASDVVFDGQGHTLDAREVDHPTEAVAAGYTDPPIENVTIRNLVVTDWTQGVGCRSIAADVTIANVTARRNGLNTAGGGYGSETETETEAYGIYVGDGTVNVTVRDSVAVDNAQGIFIANTSNNVVRDSLVASNNNGGIVLGGETWRNRIVDNTVLREDAIAIQVGSRGGVGTGNRTVIAGNTLRGNKRGVFVKDTKTNIFVRDNTVSNTTRESIWVALVHGNVTVANNVVRTGEDHGIVIDESDDIVVRNNTVRSVDGSGIRVEFDSAGTVLRANRVIDARHGLRVTDQSKRTSIRGLTVVGSRNQAVLFDGLGNNTGADIDIRGGEGMEVESPGNSLRDVNITHTGSFGLRLDGAAGTLVEGARFRTTNAHAVPTGAHAVQLVGGTANATLRNLSVSSGRVSLSGGDTIIAQVDSIPPPPAGLFDLAVGVHVLDPPGNTGGEQPPVLTMYYPENSPSNVTLWAWGADDGGWNRLSNTTRQSGQHAISADVPADRNITVVPLVSTKPPTPTSSRTATASPSRTGPPGGTPKTTPTSETVAETPGFGVGIGLFALVTAHLIGVRRRT